MNRSVSILVTLAIGAACWFCPIPDGVKPDAWHLLAILIGTIAGFILIPVKIGLVALVGLTISILTGVMSTGEALSGFSNSLLWLIVMAFMFSRAFIKTGLGERLSLKILSLIGDSTLKVAYSMTISGSLLAAGIPSGTARAGGVIYPIIRSMCSALDSEPDKNPERAGRFLIQAYYQSEAFISYLFMTAMAGNVLVMQYAHDLAKTDITWAGWAAAAFLPGIVSIILVPLVTYWVVPPTLKKAPEAKAHALKLLREMGPMSKKEIALTCIFIGSIANSAVIACSVSAVSGISASQRMSFKLSTSTLSPRMARISSSLWALLVAKTSLRIAVSSIRFHLQTRIRDCPCRRAMPGYSARTRPLPSRNGSLPGQTSGYGYKSGWHPFPS